MKHAAQKSGKKPLIITLSVVVLVLAILGVTFGLALNDPNEPITAGNQAETGITKLVAAAVTGVPANLSSEEVNDILAAKLTENTQSKIKGIRFTINNDQTVDAYLPVGYKGIKFGVSANLTVSTATENQVSATVNSMKIGRLPINPSQVLKYGKAILPNEITMDGNVLRVNTEQLKVYVLENMVEVNVSSLTVSDKNFVVGVSGNLDKLNEYIAKNYKSYMGLLG